MKIGLADVEVLTDGGKRDEYGGGIRGLEIHSVGNWVGSNATVGVGRLELYVARANEDVLTFNIIARVTVPMRTRFLSIDRGGCTPSFFSEMTSSGAGSAWVLDLDIVSERRDDDEEDEKTGIRRGGWRLICHGGRDSRSRRRRARAKP